MSSNRIRKASSCLTDLTFVVVSVVVYRLKALDARRSLH